MFNNKIIFYKYIFINFLKPFFLISFVLTGLVWLSRSLQYIDLIINKGLSVLSYFWFVSLIAPKILAFLLPLISFAAISYSYHKLKIDSELIIMESAGLSKLKLMFPALLFGFLIALSVLLIETKISPENYKKFKSFQSNLRNNFVISALQEGEFHSPFSNITVYIDELSNDGTVKNILIHDTRNKNIENTILAKKGIISNINEIPSIKVFNGSRYIFYLDTNQTSILNFDKYEFQIDFSNANQSKRFRQVEERSLKELFYPDHKFNNKIKKEFVSEGHRRLSSPLLVIFMCSLAAFSVLFGKTKKKMLAKRIIFISSLAILVQSIYIASINIKLLNGANFILVYISLILIACIPFFLIKYEDNIFNLIKFNKND